MSSASNTPPDGYFNDLSQPTGNNGRNNRQRSQDGETNGDGNGNASGGETNVPKPKRIACIICRKRKLKCDGTKPSCSTCTRLGHDCAYDEVRRKSGPKRGYVKALEERLKQVETLLKTQDPPTTSPNEGPIAFAGVQANGNGVGLRPIPATNLNLGGPSISVVGGVEAAWRYNGESPQPPMDDLSFPTDINMGMGMDDSTFTWEMIGLGLEEPLPPQETIDNLHQIYFDKIHPSVPMTHKYRYLAAMNLPPNQRPPVALRYAMWTLAASVTEKYLDLKEHFYLRARKYIEMDYLKGHGENMISVAHAQAHILLANYEFKMMFFPRAWMSTGAGVRLCQMMGLHRLDGKGLDVKQCLPPSRDWTEKEERRRTFWMAFCEDRYASIGTGWPMTVEEKDILTNLPANDDAFDMSKEETTLSLPESMSPSGSSKISAFGGIVLMACLFGRNLTHLHRPDADDRDGDLNGEFWKRHRNLDNILLNTSLSMPSQLKLPAGLSNANIVFTNMNIHTSTICLHQAAIFKADKNRLPASISAESKVRCMTAANEIASIMRMVSHMDLSSMNPFISFCLYVAARVFVQYLKSRPEDSQTGDSLRFLLSAMNALKKKNPLTESFLVQLDVDLEGLGMRNSKYKQIFAYSDDNLGISSAKMPEMGGAAGSTPGQNQCLFTRMPSSMDPLEGSGAIAVDAENDFRRNSDPATSSSDQPNWITLPDHAPTDQASKLQRTMQGFALDLNSRSTYGAQNPSFSKDSSNNDTGLSPNTGNSGSDRPTPNSSTPSDSHSHSQARSKLHPGSHNASYETSPASSHERGPVRQDTRSMSDCFSGQPDYRNITATGLTPNNNAFTMPETPGRQFQVPPGWDMSQQTTGLTPVGEGVFRQLMGLGPMDPMDIGWEGGT